MRTFLTYWVTLFFAAFSSCVVAADFPLPATGNDLIGKLQYTSVTAGEPITNITQQYNLGLNAVIAANPGANENTGLGNLTHIKIPTEYILPPLPHKGIVINLPEMRMYYYPEGSNNVMTFPIGIGKIGKTIPIINTAVVRKVVNPTWVPTPSIREFNKERGIELPYAMGAGPDNPLGPYAIYLRIPTYLIHSTIFPESIGRRASFGCIRMNESDIKEFYPLVTPGTPVEIINMPTKIGWNGDHLLIESHPLLEEHAISKHDNLISMIREVENETQGHGVILVNWQVLPYLADEPDGVPHEIGVKVKSD